MKATHAPEGLGPNPIADSGAARGDSRVTGLQVPRDVPAEQRHHAHLILHALNRHRDPLDRALDHPNVPDPSARLATR